MKWERKEKRASGARLSKPAFDKQLYPNSGLGIARGEKKTRFILNYQFPSALHMNCLVSLSYLKGSSPILRPRIFSRTPTKLRFASFQTSKLIISVTFSHRGVLTGSFFFEFARHSSRFA